MFAGKGIDKATLDAIDAIETKDDKFSVFDCVHGFGAKFGFAYTTIGQLIHPTLQNIDYAELGVSNFPADFQQTYIENNYLIQDPVINHCLTAQDAFTWDELIRSASHRGRQIFEECHAAGLEYGVTVPIHLQDRTPGIVSYAGPQIDLKQDDIKALELVGIHGYSRLLDIYTTQKTVTRIRLTPREVDVLHHVACGKQDMEIARLLKLGHHSVKDHLANARKKLGAANRAHCVVIAIRDGHIIL